MEKETVVAPLEGDAAVERVIDEETGRTYSIPAEVSKLDPMFCTDGKLTLEYNNPVRVLNDEGRLVGFALLEPRDGRLFADMALEYSSPERLLIETGSERLYAKPFGAVMLLNWHAGLEHSLRQPLIMARVDGLVITRKPPLPDSRPIGDVFP